MGSQGEAKRPARPDRASRRITVDGDGKPRPFMRGIMVHSLMARGVPFEDAFRTANEVRARIGARASVNKSEIAAWIREILGGEPFQEERRVPVPVDITIIGPAGKGLPFSKGVLSQSLLAAAIDPNDAFDVAREIERELIARDVRQIDRRELRRLAYQTLARHMGEATGERYLQWRKYQHPERPVIILLGGAAGRRQDLARARGGAPARHRARLLDRLRAPDHADHALPRAGAGDPRLLLRRLAAVSRRIRSATIRWSRASARRPPPSPSASAGRSTAPSPRTRAS